MHLHVACELQKENRGNWSLWPSTSAWLRFSGQVAAARLCQAVFLACVDSVRVDVLTVFDEALNLQCVHTTAVTQARQPRRCQPGGGHTASRTALAWPGPPHLDPVGVGKPIP